MGIYINTPTTPGDVNVPSGKVAVFHNSEDANNLWVKDASGARPIVGAATLPYLELDNPGATIVEADIGKFAMPHPSTAGAAALYAWESFPEQTAQAELTSSFFATYDQHPERYEVQDTDESVLLTATVGTDFSAGADDSTRMAALATYLTDEGYPATADGDTITVDWSAAGAAGNDNFLREYGNTGSGVVVSGSETFSGGVDAYDIPTAPVLGKIVAVTDTRVTIDNLTSRGYCTAVGEVNNRTILLPADGGDGVVDYLILSSSGPGGPIVSLGTAQNAAVDGQEVFVDFHDPIAALILI